MSKRCQFKVCSHHPLYYCIMFTRSSLSCLLAFYGIPIFQTFLIRRIFYFFTCILLVGCVICLATRCLVLLTLGTDGHGCAVRVIAIVCTKATMMSNTNDIIVLQYDCVKHNENLPVMHRGTMMLPKAIQSIKLLTTLLLPMLERKTDANNCLLCTGSVYHTLFSCTKNVH